MRDGIKEEKLSKYQPPRDLEIYCQVLVSQDVKGNKAMAQRLSHIDTGKFEYAWRSKPQFREWYLKLAIDVLAKNAAIPAYALMGAVIDKDVQAIRTFYELVGQLKGNGINLQVGDTVIQTPHAVIFSDIDDVDMEPKKVEDECIRK